MQLGFYDWIFIILEMFGTYVIYKFMEVFYNTRKASNQVIYFTYSIFYLISVLMFIYVNVPVVLMIFNLIALFALSFNYESTMKHRILSSVFIYLILAGVEIVVGLLTGYLDFSLYTTTTFSSLYGLIACRIGSYAVVLVLHNFKNIKRGQTVPNSYWISIALIPVASLYVNLLLLQARGISVIQVMIGIAFILLINFATFYLYDVITAALSDKMQNMLILEQNKYYDKQLEMIKTSLQTTSMIRHDLSNHMFSIKSLIENGDAKESLDYISKIADDIGTRKDYATSGNTVIDSIINFKFQEAVQNGIVTSLDLRIPEKMEIPSFDMTILLGNLLDNAIKAAAKVSGEKYVKLKIRFDKGRLMIQAENPFAGEINEEDGMLLTTNEDKINHGIGLQSVKKVLQKYDGIMNIEHSGNVFSVSLMMYVD